VTCHRVPMSPSLCTCGAVLDITQWHGDDDIGNDLCPTCSGCGCELNERNERVTVPTDTPSTDGAPEPEEVVATLNVIFHGDEPACRAACTHVLFEQMTALGLANVVGRRLAGFRVVPEDRPAPCPHCNDDGVVHTYDGIVLGPCDCPAGVPALDDDTRREVLTGMAYGLTAAALVTDHRRAAKVALERAASDNPDEPEDRLMRIARFHDATADLLAAAYLGGTEHG